MTAPVTADLPSPLLIFHTINAFQRTAALKAAIDLDLFTAIGQSGEGGALTSEIAARCRAAERGVRILSDAMTVLGFLRKTDGRYFLTRDTAIFLDRRSPMYIGVSVRFLLHPLMTAAYDSLSDAARKGGTAMENEGTTSPEHSLWVDFAEGMGALQALPAELLAQLLNADSLGPCKVLDIAAGHGMFGITIAKHNPKAEIVGLDWPNVLEVARRNAHAAGLNSRYRTIEGSAFEVELGSDYDLVLLTNILHHFDPATCEALLRRVLAALKPGGRAVTLEFVPNEDRVSPPDAALFSVVMLASTPAGDAYTFAEFDTMFRNAGFARNEALALPPSPSTVIISHKA